MSYGIYIIFLVSLYECVTVALGETVQRIPHVTCINNNKIAFFTLFSASGAPKQQSLFPPLDVSAHSNPGSPLKLRQRRSVATANNGSFLGV